MSTNSLGLLNTEKLLKAEWLKQRNEGKCVFKKLFVKLKKRMPKSVVRFICEFIRLLFLNFIPCTCVCTVCIHTCTCVSILRMYFNCDAAHI